MHLREFFSPDAIRLRLEGTTKDEILKELISLLALDEKSEGMLYKMLKRRENLGSTGIGRGIAIPHCRSLVVSRLRVAFGRKPYLPVLGKVAQFAKEPDVPEQLATLDSPGNFIDLLGQKDI
jgi:mannitol/fructose-specific phosphotransferase system IIA component (Ntr-type)